MKSTNKKKKKNLKIEFVVGAWAIDKDNTKRNPKIEKAADLVAKECHDHFNLDGWDLAYDSVLAEVFYTAYGKHLESFFLEALTKYSKEYKIVYSVGERPKLVKHDKTKVQKKRK